MVKSRLKQKIETGEHIEDNWIPRSFKRVPTVINFIDSIVVNDYCFSKTLILLVKAIV